jgi:DNA polymerase
MPMASDNLDNLVEEMQRSLRWLAGSGWKGFDCSPETLSRLQGWSRPLAASAKPAREVQRPSEIPPPATPALAQSESLESIREDLGDCHRCKLWRQRRHIVFGQGDPRARLVFVGEGPGFDEDQQGEPFVGAAGQLLTRIIQAMGLAREQVYICNIIKCRPPNNRNPETDEISACLPFLQRQLAAISPDCICALGSVAARALLETDLPISRLRGQFHQYRGIAVMPTFHPAYLLRNPEQKRAVWEDVQQLMARLKLTPPVKP